MSPGPSPSEPAARPSVSAAARQAAPGLERVERRDHRPDDDQRARGEQRHRRGVADAAEQEQDRVGERLPHLAAGPAEVEDAREEGGERHEPEPDQVPVALLEHGQLELGPPGPAGSGVASGACGMAITPAFDGKSPAPSLPWGRMSGRPRVLVVEDDADIAGVLRRSLDKEGYEVRVAGDGEAALERVGRVRARRRGARPRAARSSTAWRSPGACAPRATCRS